MRKPSDVYENNFFGPRRRERLAEPSIHTRDPDSDYAAATRTVMEELIATARTTWVFVLALP